MLYDMDEQGTIRGVTYTTEMTASLLEWKPDHVDYVTALAAYDAQEAAGATSYTEPTGPFVAPWTVTLPGSLPAGTHLMVKIESGQIFDIDLDAQVDPIILNDPGFYDLQLLPPAPDRGYYTKIEVT